MIGRELKQKRKEKGLTQKQLAEKANVTLPTIHNVETNIRKNSIERIVEALGCEIVVVEKSM